MSLKIKTILVVTSLSSLVFVFLSIPFSFKIGGVLISSVPEVLARGFTPAPEPSTLAVLGIAGLYFSCKNKILGKINKIRKREDI